MSLRKVILIGLLTTGGFSGGLTPAAAEGSDWLLAPSYYSHDPETGKRTTQYAPAQPAYIFQNPSYQKSGYRHRRSTIRNSEGGFDQFHVVEEWGRPVRPYGEWERPFRPYSVPYHLWGEPFGGLGPFYQNFGPWPGDFPYRPHHGGHPHGGHPHGGHPHGI